MKSYKTQSEVEKDIKNGVLEIEGDVKFECSITIETKIIVNAGNINAWDINAWDINAGNINARNINARNINARDINARDINAGNINARNINARDINAWDINARNILYYAFCCVYKSIQCRSIKTKREKYQEPICLEGKLEIRKEQELNLSSKIVEVKIDEKTYKARIIV